MTTPLPGMQRDSTSLRKTFLLGICHLQSTLRLISLALQQKIGRGTRGFRVTVEDCIIALMVENSFAPPLVDPQTNSSQAGPLEVSSATPALQQGAHDLFQSSFEYL